MSDSPVAPPDPLKGRETLTEKLRRERRAVALNALSLLTHHAHGRFAVADHMSHDDLNDQHRTVSTLIGEFEIEVNDADRLLATERQSHAAQTIRDVEDQWFLQGGKQQFHDDRMLTPARSADELVSNILAVVRQTTDKQEADLAAARAEIAAKDTELVHLRAEWGLHCKRREAAEAALLALQQRVGEQLVALQREVVVACDAAIRLDVPVAELVKRLRVAASSLTGRSQ